MATVTTITERRPKTTSTARPTRKTIRILVGLSLFSVSSLYFGGQWDAAEHAKGAVDRFWYPPHFGIYLSLLMSAVLTGVAFVLVLRGPGGIGEKIRRNPLLSALAVANFLGVSGAPLDAWWHETFGLDLTVWSPPHLHILLGTTLAVFCAWAFFLDRGPVARPLTLLGRFDGRALILGFAGALALAMSMYLFTEYEWGAVGLEVMARPDWTYPVAWSLYAGFMLGVIAGGSRLIGLATFTAAIYTVIRLLAHAADVYLLDYHPPLSYPLLLPAILFDVLLALTLRRAAPPGAARLALVGLAVGAALAASTWWFGSVMQLNRAVAVDPWPSWWPLALPLAAGGALAGWWAGTLLRRLRPEADGHGMRRRGAEDAEYG